MVIRSFRDKETEKVFRREFSRKFQRMAAVAKRKLDQVPNAVLPHPIAGKDLQPIPRNPAGLNPMLLKLR